MASFNKVCIRVQGGVRTYLGAFGPGLSRSGIKRPGPASGKVPDIDRSQYKIYLDQVDENTYKSPSVKLSELPVKIPGAKPSGWVPPPASIPDLPYFIWRNVDKALPVEHKQNEKFHRFTQISRIEGDIQTLRDDIEGFLNDETVPVVANENTGTITCLGWRAFEIKKWLQLQGF